jgi:HAD superfamily hydrolase (TIGR01484 family)
MKVLRGPENQIKTTEDAEGDDVKNPLRSASTLRWGALATDYDGTLANSGRVAAATFEALERVRRSGRKLLLVTGRELKELFDVFPPIAVFDRVVAENGALIFDPATGKRRLLAHSPRKLVSALEARRVKPLSVGHAIVATTRRQQRIVSKAIDELGLPLQLILNKRSLMVLPRGVNKASGLRNALRELGIAAAETVGIGDAENDEEFLAICGYSAAVANALPKLKRQVDTVTSAGHGEGVVELVEQLLNGRSGHE